MKAVVAAFNQEKALVGAFSVIVQPVVEPMEHYTALLLLLLALVLDVALYLRVAHLDAGVELEGAARLQVELVQAPVLEVPPHDHGAR